MSRQTKKPAQQVATKVKNIKLLPSVLATDPNKKMLDATLDVMTSKGQMLSFSETYGLRSASNRTNEFFIAENNEVRRESQSNTMLVLKDSADNYTGKVSYLDIDNYFKIKNSPLLDGTVLDKNINVLDLPINPYKITDYNLFYWLENDLPACRIHLEAKSDGTPKFSIKNDLLNKTFVTLVDDLTGRSLNLQTGMIVYFTGVLNSDDAMYLSEDEHAPKTFFVYSVGETISLISTTQFEKRIPHSYFKKRTWDKGDPFKLPPAINWDSEEWDGSRLVSSDPEYVTQERFSTNASHWESIDHWYHITTIRAVANFLGTTVDSMVSAENRAKRPIITFTKGLKLYNWPSNIKGEVKSIMPYSRSKYNGLITLKDSTGYQLINGDRVVFEDDPGIYTVAGVGTSISFSLTTNTVNNDGALIVNNNEFLYYRLIYKNNKWQFAQNKVTPNQTPLFEFYNSKGQSLSSLNESNFAGGAILGFKAGDVYDVELDKNIEVSSIDFDLVNENNSSAVSPNQIKFYTEVDSSWSYTDLTSGEEVVIKGPYGYSSGSSIFSFYTPRRGLNISKQLQDLTYVAESEEIWSDTIIPPARTLNDIHVYYASAEGLQFYTTVEGYGLVRLSSKRSFNKIEQLLPLKSGNTISIICHNLPVPFSLVATEVHDNITRPMVLAEPYCINNGITDGIIYLDLNDSISIDGSTYVDNIIARENTLLYYQFGSVPGTSNPVYKTALVKPESSWRFLQNVHVKDKTNPVYNGYDFNIIDEVLPDGALSGLNRIQATSNILNKVSIGDKIIVDSIINNPVQKTAPMVLTANPLNKELSTLNYYSLYQHATNLKSNATNSKEYVEFESLLQSSLLGGGTLLKHSSPLSKFGIMATNMPFDFTSLLVKQSKHYDLFLNKLKVELEYVIDNYDSDSLSSYDMLSLAINRIFVTKPTDDKFWVHSNMIGWGDKPDNYREDNYLVNGNFDLTGNFEPISLQAGKELLLQLSYNNKFLVRGKDYTLLSDDDYYTSIEFSSELMGKEINIKQWYARFKSQIPASLAKIGLYPSYNPEIYRDSSSSAYFLVRHDGSKNYLPDGVDDNNYPNNKLDQLLYEYELAVFANLSYNVLTNDFREIFENRPGLFRRTSQTLSEYNTAFVDGLNNWAVENNIYDNTNSAYDPSNSFTAIYQIGSGDDNNTIVGSWRLIYKYVFDTDRPHTHPWEMLGYTIKPRWWDTYYSWTEPSKRVALERSLRTGRLNPPSGSPILNPAFAKCNSKIDNQTFPVNELGELLAPDHESMSWLSVYKLDETVTWANGYFGPYEQVFANIQQGIAAMTATYYINSPILYVNRNWVPGQQVKNEWGQYIDRTSGTWQQCKIEHDYHRKVVNGETVYTSGIESLYAEHCLINNVDFIEHVVTKFNNVVVNKEFLLQSFTNKDNVKIQSTSINSQRQTLFIPEENYAVRTVKHFPAVEKLYSGLRIIYDGSKYSVYGFNKEYTYLSIYKPTESSSTITVDVAGIKIKQKNSYNKDSVVNLNYGSSFKNRFDLYDTIIGYGKYLEDQGFIFDQPEGGDIRDWQLSAKQFIYWSNDQLAPGSYIDLNPAADYLILKNIGGHIDNIEGTNQNSSQCVDRNNKPLFGKDLLVFRNDDANRVVIQTKDKDRSIYGIKLTYSYYESVLHLDSTSVFGDIYFLPEQGTTKRSFVLAGKKTDAWTGEYFAPGFIFANGNIIPNLDSMSEQGRNILDIESSIVDPAVREASKDQFGLNRNIELKQLFLHEDNELLFKNAITYNKGTVEVFNSLEPLSHQDSSNVSIQEEYMVRTGEFGNTENINYYEFELLSEDLNRDYHEYQIIKFIDSSDETIGNDRILHIKDNSPCWVYKPRGKDLRFNTFTSSYTKLKTNGPLLSGDTNYQIDSIDDLASLYAGYADLWTIPHYSATSSYKKYDKVRFAGKLFYAKTTISPNTWANNNDKFTQIDEPWLPNIFVNNYYKPNPDLAGTGNSIFTPGTWQVLQTIDRNIGIDECCAGPNDTSKARISTIKPHGLSKGDYVVVINTQDGNLSVDGIWKVDSVESTTMFYVNTRIANTIKQGKIFPLKPVRFKNINELNLATGNSADSNGYAWKKKYVPFTNAIGDTNVELEPTPSGYSQTYPIAIVDDGMNTNDSQATYDFGNYKVYSINDTSKTLLKEESMPVDPSDIEHLIVYDYSSNKTLAKLELFDPKKLLIPQAFKDDIDVIGRTDPARYNRTTDEYKSVYTSLAWYEEMVGKRWWDISTLGFNDYESGDELTKAKFWGTTFNNNTADIYEWTRSPVHPKDWETMVAKKAKINGQIASGEVYVDKTLGNDNYHWVEEEDYASGNTYTVYYFWVKNKNTIANESRGSRIYTTRQLGNYILNPSAAGLAWWAPVSNNAIIVKGIDTYLNNSSTVIQIKKKTKGNEKHHQWTFISDSNAVATVPEWIHVRFRDSISSHIFYRIVGTFVDFSAVDTYKQGDIVRYRETGKFYVCRVHMTGEAGALDVYNATTNPNGAWFELSSVFEVTGSLIGTWDGYFWDKIVWDYSLDKFWFWKAKNIPDPVNLHRYNKLGNSVRPYIQGWFDNILEARRTFIKRLNEIMINVDVITIPNWGSTRLNNTAYTIADDLANITKYWSYVDFQSADFDSTKAISLVLENEADIYVSPVDVGDYVKINTGIKDYVIYRKNEDQSYSVVYRTNGAIEFDKILYDPISLSEYDTAGYDKYPWDFDLNSVYNAIVDALRNEIFVGEYSKYYSTIICAMFRYVLSEQVNVDWLTKSSTIEPVNLLGKSLVVSDTLRRDEISTLSNFYSSVKSYRDKIRSGTVNKTSGDTANTEISEGLFISEFDTDGNLTNSYNII